MGAIVVRRWPCRRPPARPGAIHLLPAARGVGHPPASVASHPHHRWPHRATEVRNLRLVHLGGPGAHFPRAVRATVVCGGGRPPHAREKARSPYIDGSSRTRGQRRCTSQHVALQSSGGVHKTRARDSCGRCVWSSARYTRYGPKNDGASLNR